MDEIIITFRTRIYRWVYTPFSGQFPFYIVLAAFTLMSFLLPFLEESNKAFTSETWLWGLDYMFCILTVQAMGYVPAIFFQAQLAADSYQKILVPVLLQLMMVAVISHLLSALVPAPCNIPFSFTNGLSVGVIWALIFSNRS